MTSLTSSGEVIPLSKEPPILHISYREGISCRNNSVESLAVSTAWNDKIKLLNVPNSV